MIRELCGPQEVVPAGHGVDGADQHLDADLHHPLPGHGDAPVVRAIINHEQLKTKSETSVIKIFLNLFFQKKIAKCKMKHFDWLKDYLDF